jgi:hypothetical protein
MPVRKLVADRLCRYEPFRRVGGRHPNVDDDELGLVLAHELEELVRVAGLADHPKTRPLEHARDALTEKDVVVGHHDPTRVVRGRIDRPSTLRGPACRPHTCCPLCGGIDLSPSPRSLRLRTQRRQSADRPMPGYPPRHDDRFVNDAQN